MRVLHVINYLGRGGAEKLLVNILPVYKKLGLEVTVMQLSDRQAEPSHLKSLTDQGIECLHLADLSVYSPVHIFKLAGFLRKRQFQMIHVHLFPSLYWTALAYWLLNYRPILVYTEHSTQNKRAGKTYLRLLEKWIYSHYTQVVAITTKVKSFLEGRVCYPGQITVIHNGVDLDAFQNAQGYSNSFWSTEFDLPSDAVKLLITARIQYPKDHKTLIEAMELLPPHFHLLIAGDGPDKRTIEALAKEKQVSNRVIFLGFRSDIPRLMKSVDINILSSAYEGMSGVTLEGLAAGRPFLGSDVPGINDVVPLPDMLFPVGDASALSRKILTISQMPPPELAALTNAGLAQASKNSLLQMAKNHIRMYEHLLSPSKK